MIVVKCPTCGQDITVENDNVTLIQCSCGAVIPNYAKAYGQAGFNNQVDVNVTIEMQRKNVNKMFKIMVVVFSSLIVLLSIGTYFLYKNVNSKLPLITIIPLIIFLIIALIVASIKRKKVLDFLDKKIKTPN